MHDKALLDQFRHQASDEAFSELVDRHLQLVYGVAYRILQDHASAQDTAQTVFISLAQKAQRLPADTILAGWLYRATQLAARQLIRTESRRHHRETNADLPNETALDSLDQWFPALEEGMSKLDSEYRDLLVLRFFKNQSMAEIAETLAIREDAAKKRVSRALEKLRRLLPAKNINISALALTLSMPFAVAVPSTVKAAVLQSVAAPPLHLVPIIKLVSSQAPIAMTKSAVILHAAALVSILTCGIYLNVDQAPSKDVSISLAMTLSQERALLRQQMERRAALDSEIRQLNFAISGEKDRLAALQKDANPKSPKDAVFEAMLNDPLITNLSSPSPRAIQDMVDRWYGGLFSRLKLDKEKQKQLEEILIAKTTRYEKHKASPKAVPEPTKAENDQFNSAIQQILQEQFPVYQDYMDNFGFHIQFNNLNSRLVGPHKLTLSQVDQLISITKAAQNLFVGGDKATQSAYQQTLRSQIEYQLKHAETFLNPEQWKMLQEHLNSRLRNSQEDWSDIDQLLEKSPQEVK